MFSSFMNDVRYSFAKVTQKTQNAKKHTTITAKKRYKPKRLFGNHNTLAAFDEKSSGV